MSDSVSSAVLPESEWTARARRYRDRAQAFLDRHATGGRYHPVWDFLFTYYSLRPGALVRWHPGYGVTLAGPAGREYRGRSGYISTPDGMTVSSAYLENRLDTVTFVTGLLAATAQRPAQYRCFGLHEWAMVYRADRIRHDGVPLRLGPAGTDAVVQSLPLRCSHFDAYRFFTTEARPRNAVALTRDQQVSSEQPGCVHANMDLYKWSYKLGPLIDSELLLDCLLLAAAARELDMRASPYDLTDYGLQPIRIEESGGRAEYVRLQTDIADRAAPLRAELLRHCRELLENAAFSGTDDCRNRVAQPARPGVMTTVTGL